MKRSVRQEDVRIISRSFSSTYTGITGTVCVATIQYLSLGGRVVEDPGNEADLFPVINSSYTSLATVMGNSYFIDWNW